MPRKHDIDPHVFGAAHRRIEILHLEPEKYSVPVRPILRIANRPMVVQLIKAM